MPEPITNPELFAPYLEDAAHYPGGKAAGLYRPKNEAEIIAILQKHHASGHPLQIQGARTSLTGGATPMGETVLSLENLNQILKFEKLPDGTGEALLEPFVRLQELNQKAEEEGLYYPPTPTYQQATIGGTVATCASGAATFKYGTTRDWVTYLKIILANGETLSVERGKCFANNQGLFEIKTDAGHPISFHHPTAYTTPIHLKKVSCGYVATPNMDLIDFFIGSEGTLGVITQIKVRLIPLPSSILSGLGFFDSEEQAFEFVKSLRSLKALDVRAMEFFDYPSLELIQSSGASQKFKIPIPETATSGIFFEIELKESWKSEQAFHILETFVEKADASDQKPTNELEHLFQQLHFHGALNLEELVLGLPEDQETLHRLQEIREAVPRQINEIISHKQAKDPKITKVAADTVVPFERLPEMIQAFRQAAKQAFLKIVIFGHISDGNLHPNILVNNSQEMAHAKDSLQQAMKQVLELGGAPMAEHGVGRNTIKQKLLKEFYGEQGVQEMAHSKLELDPRGIFSPDVIFSKHYLIDKEHPSTLKIGATVQDVGDEQGELWQFSLKSLTKAQNFVNGFLARFLLHSPQAQTIMKQLQQIGHRTSGYMTDYIAIPYSIERIQELKRRGFVQDSNEKERVVFRHIEGIFPPFIIRPTLLEPIDPKVLEEHIPIEYEFDEEDIWVPLEDVWAHLPTLEDSYKAIALEKFEFLKDYELPELEIGWRVGNLKHFKITPDKIKGGPLYQKTLLPKTKEKEPQLTLVQRQIGLYNSFNTSRKVPSVSVSFKVVYEIMKCVYQIFYELFVFSFGMERLIRFLNLVLSPKWTRHLLNEVHDAEWLRNTPKGKKDKENIDSILGKGGWKIFIDHRTLRRSLKPHLSLCDRFLKVLRLEPKKTMSQNEVCFRVLTSLELEKHEDYIPSKDSDWKARVMRDRDRQHQLTRSQLAYFLDEALPGRRGNIATYAAFWGATTGWAWFDTMLALLGIDWGPDPWFFHHIAIEGNFETLAKATTAEKTTHDYVTSKKVENAEEVGFLDRFSFMWFLRQVFSKEVRHVSKGRLQALYLAGRLTLNEYTKYLEVVKQNKTIVEGPHIEIIDRRSGIPWFNQVRVTQAIATSSEVKIETSSTEDQDLIEPWKQRVKRLFSRS